MLKPALFLEPISALARPIYPWRAPAPFCPRTKISRSSACIFENDVDLPAHAHAAPVYDNAILGVGTVLWILGFIAVYNLSTQHLPAARPQTGVQGNRKRANHTVRPGLDGLNATPVLEFVEFFRALHRQDLLRRRS